METHKITSVVVVDGRREGRRRRAPPRSVAHADDLALRFAVRDVHVSDLNEKASRIRLLLFDVDGVLTDGLVIMHADGSESKGFHIRDGAAIVWAQRAGLPVGLLSARSSGATSHRAAQLAIRIVPQGVPSKLAGYEQILRTSADRGCSGRLHGR